MVEWLNSVSLHNGIDLMPHFNRSVAQARKMLLQNPQMLQAIATSIELSGSIAGQKEHYSQIVKRPYRHASLPGLRKADALYDAFNKLEFANVGLKEAVAMLDIPLPAVEHGELLESFNNLIAATHQQINAREDDRSRVAKLIQQARSTQSENPRLCLHLD